MSKTEILAMIKYHGWESVYDQETIPQDFIVEYGCYLNVPFLFADNKLSKDTALRFDSIISQELSENMYNSIPDMIDLMDKYFPDYRLEVIYTNKKNLFNLKMNRVILEVHFFIERSVSMDITIGPGGNTIRAISSLNHTVQQQYFGDLTEEGFISKVNSTIFHLFN